MKKETLAAELLEAAWSCGKSLQKKMALPDIAGLCERLAAALLDGTWKPCRFTRFAVQEPKLREIFAPDFADRVAETWLMALVKKPLSRLLIEDTYANRQGGGTYAAIARAQRLMRRPGNVWCLQLDIRNFFNSIHRPTLASLWETFVQRMSLPPERLALVLFLSCHGKFNADQFYRISIEFCRVIKTQCLTFTISIKTGVKCHWNLHDA